MYLLLSGEGPGDIGHCAPPENDAELQYRPGPMAWFIDQLIEHQLGYEFSHIECEQVEFVSKTFLAEEKHTLPKRRKSMGLPGKGRSRETKYYFENARTLAKLAKAKSEQLGEPVIAVLFRDADGTASAGRGEWQDKFDSMLRGFATENFDHGVPMLPKPKSEAWLLCAVKDAPYQHCAILENESGNDDSPNSLKAQLAGALNDENSTSQINDQVLDRQIDVMRIDMPSFNQFKEELSKCVQRVAGHTS